MAKFGCTDSCDVMVYMCLVYCVFSLRPIVEHSSSPSTRSEQN